MAGLNIPSGAYKINGVDVTSTLKLKQSTGLTYNPANPFVFDKEYQYNNYTLTSNITPTYSLTNAVPLTFTQITFIGDGIHTVDFSNFTESDLSGTFDTTLGVENKVVFYYDGYDILYSVISAARIATSSITGLLSSTDWTTFNSKQAALVSGTNIKTINSTSLLGSGDIAVQPTLVSGTNIKTINGTSVLGSGDLTISTGVTPTDNILDWSVANNGYQPYSTQQATLSFDTSSTAPTSTTRLNLNGNFYSTNLYTGLAQTTAVIATGTVVHPNIPNGYMEMYMYNNAGTYVGRLFSYTGSTYKDLAIGDWNGGNPNIMLKVGGNVGFGVGNPTAVVHLKAGTTTNPPLKLTAGTNLTTPEAGAIEFDGTHFYGTIGSTRYQLDQQSTPAIADNIFSWDAVNKWYAPYTSKQASMSFYTGTDMPDLTTRLNLDAKLYAPAINLSNDTGTVLNITSNNNTALNIVSNLGYGIDASGTIGVKGHSSSNNGYGIYGTAYAGSAGKFTQAYNTSNTASLLVLERTISGSGLATGNIISITDNPTTSGTISGKVLSATIGSTERISLNPRVADGASAVAYMFSTHNTLSDNAARILSLKNNTAEVFYVNQNGTTHTRTTYAENAGATGFYSYIDFTNNSIVCNNLIRLNLNPNISDNASAVAYLFDTHNNLTTTGAKLASFKNQGVEKVYFNNHGNIARTVGTSSTFVTVGGVLKDFYTDASTSDVTEEDLYSYSVPAYTLANNGDKLIMYTTVTTNSSGNITLAGYFAGQQVGGMSATYGGVDRTGNIKMTIIRTSSSTARAEVIVKLGATSYTDYFEITGKDWTQANIMKVTASAANNAVTARMGYIEYKPAAIN